MKSPVFIRGQWPLFGLFLALLVLLFVDVIWSGGSKVLGTLPSDLTQFFLTARDYGFSNMRMGRLVKWDPYHFGGKPFLGDPETVLFYPLNLLYLFLPLGAAVDWDIIIHLAIGGFGIFGWVNRRTGSPEPAFLAACVYTLGGAHFPQLISGHIVNIEAMAWTPFLFWCLDGWLDEATFGWLLGGAGIVALQALCGQGQYLFDAFWGLAAYGLWVGWARGKLSRAFQGLITVYGAGAMLAAVQLIPCWRMTVDTLRGKPLDWDTARTFSFPLENLLTLVLPSFFGPGEGLPYWGRWYHSEASLFIGMTAFALVLWGLLRMDGTRERAVAGGLGLVFLLLALGDGTPFFGFCFRYLPGFDLFRGPAKFNALTLLFLAVAAADGLKRLGREGEGGLGKVSRWLLVLGLTGLFAGLFLDGWFGSGGKGLWEAFLNGTEWGKAVLEKVVREKRPEFLTFSRNLSAVNLLEWGGTCLVLALILGWAPLRRKRVFGSPFFVSWNCRSLPSGIAPFSPGMSIGSSGMSSEGLPLRATVRDAG